LTAAESDIEASCACGDPAGWLNAIAARPPAVLLLDFVAEEHFPSLLLIRTRAPQARVVLWVNRISLEAAYQAMRAGARGILRKALPAELVLKCIRKVAVGELWFEKELTAGFLSARSVNLTRRESQLVRLVSEGLKNKEIASEMGISNATVRIYLSALFQKLGVKDRYELAIYGLRNMAAGVLARTPPPAGLPESREIRSILLVRSA
jgi:DNA-binding NarL/FixJ family response regulator